VAPLATREIVTAKGPLPVVTGNATKRAGRSMVVKRLRCTYLNSLRHAGPDPMTFIAGQSFRLIVLCMAEAHPKCLGVFARADMTTRLVTNAAGRNVPIARLSARSVALITGIMSVQSRGNCHGHAGARRSMTNNATNAAAHSRVARVIEFHVEAA